MSSAIMLGNSQNTLQLHSGVSGRSILKDLWVIKRQKSCAINLGNVFRYKTEVKQKYWINYWKGSAQGSCISFRVDVKDDFQYVLRTLEGKIAKKQSSKRYAFLHISILSLIFEKKL